MCPLDSTSKIKAGWEPLRVVRIQRVKINHSLVIGSRRCSNKGWWCWCSHYRLIDCSSELLVLVSLRRIGMATQGGGHEPCDGWRCPILPTSPFHDGTQYVPEQTREKELLRVSRRVVLMGTFGVSSGRFLPCLVYSKPKAECNICPCMMTLTHCVFNITNNLYFKWVD